MYLYNIKGWMQKGSIWFFHLISLKTLFVSTPQNSKTMATQTHIRSHFGNQDGINAAAQIWLNTRTTITLWYPMTPGKLMFVCPRVLRFPWLHGKQMIPDTYKEHRYTVKAHTNPSIMFLFINRDWRYLQS